MTQYFLKAFGGDINIKVDLSNCATSSDLKNVSHVNVSSFALKSNLANLKSEGDKVHIAKLATVPNDLARVSNVIKNDVVKNTVYDKLVAKVNNIDITWLVLKTTHGTDKSSFEKKISDADKKILDTRELAK